MYVCRPEPNKRAAYTLIILCLCAALMLLWPSSLEGFWGAMPPAAGILFLLLAFMTTCRYLLTSYVYRIDERDGIGYDLTVEQIFVKRRRTLCRIAVEDIAKISEVAGKRKKEKNKKHAPKCVTYRYFSELLCRKYIIMELSEDGERIRIMITPDGKLTGILRELSGAE